MSGFKQILKGIAAIIALICMCVECAASVLPSSEYYYSANRKNNLVISNKSLAVRFKENVSLGKREQIINADANLESFAQRYEVSAFKLTFLPLREGKTRENVIQTINNLKSKPEVEVVCPVFHFPDAELTVTDEFIVKFKPSATKDEIKAFNELNHVEIVRKPRWTDRYTLRVKNPKDTSAIEVANLYYENPITVFSMPNFMRKLQPMSTPNDTYFPNQWHLNNTGQDPPAGTPGADINAPEGWGVSVGSSSIVIAIIDEGVDLTHEDLASNIVDGYDFVNDDTDATPYGNDAHGTACAGLAAGVTNNNKGISGVSWKCKIMPIRMASGEFGSYWTTEEWAANAIEWASDNGADVLSNSWGGGPDSDTIHDAIKEAKNNGRNGKGCIVVFSSGNGSGGVSYPAKYSEVIAVGATDEDDVRYSYSNYGNELDVVAPSGLTNLQGNIWTTDITGSAGYNSGSTSQGDAAGNYTKKMGGTSASAPQVAGLAGLILSINPNLISNEVQEIIEGTADDKGDNGWDQYYGWGRINIHSALIEAGGLKINVDDGLGSGDCVLEDDYIEYTISYSNPVTDPNKPGYVGDANDLVITDYLTDEMDFILADPNNGSYDPNEHTYTWNIGKLSPGQGGNLLLKVQVTDTIEPLSEITNTVEQTSDISHLWATEKTQVCCFGGEVIYVDASINAPDPNGSSWNTALNNLVDALAAATICDEIWVAKAENTYKPTTNPANHTATFSLLKGVGLYGGFFGDETERWQRNWYENETILSGVIDSAENEPNRIDYVIVSDANNTPTILDGFTITGGSLAGVHCEQSSPLISHNKITDNAVGIYCYESEQPVIKNNWLYKNDYGLYFEQDEDAAIVRNNTVANNTIAGIYMNTGKDPEISNCIIWGHPNGYDLVDCNSIYSCITDGDIGQGNIDGDPNYLPFVDGDNDDYHLHSNSPCIDSGDTAGDYTGQRDIDKHFRLLDGDGVDGKRVDMGADEYCNQGTDNVADFNDDGIVDTLDLAEMGGAWLVDANDPDWVSQYDMYDLYDDDVIDFVDFAYFNQEWLWIACWKMPDIPTEQSMFMGGDWYSSSMLMTETQEEGPIESQPYSEPTIEEQIEQIKEILDWLYEVKNEIDEDTWLSLVTILEEMLKELEQD